MKATASFGQYMRTMAFEIPSHNTLTVPTEDSADPPWFAGFDLGRTQGKAQTGKQIENETLNDLDPWSLPGSTAGEVSMLSCRSKSALSGIAHSHHATAAVDGEAAAQGSQREIASVTASDRLSAIPGGMTAGPAASGDNATVVVCELDGDITPTEDFDREKGDTMAKLATIADESILYQRIEAARNAARVLAAQEEMALYGMDDEERVAPGKFSLEALEQMLDQYEEDMRRRSERLLVEEETEYKGALRNHGAVVVNPANGTHGVPVLTATTVEVGIPRRDSGIKFTLTRVDDGYREDEVLFDDDFLFEEEIMDPDYFRKKDKERGHGLSFAVEVM
ncbi:hypothetical protein SLS56_005408 [Neofusicoccum ribis]|uniref:Uncharacterized protein n=1 Tax=Neofusicoccum ribis TaxID=45134 RepID=A0ABR3STN1_9PEZI